MARRRTARGGFIAGFALHYASSRRKIKDHVKTYNETYRNFVVNPKADISALHRSGHFSFALTKI